MRRSKRLAQQSEGDNEEDSSDVTNTSAADGPGEAEGPMEAGPTTENDLNEEDMDGKDQQPDEEHDAEDDTEEDSEGLPELDDFEEDARAAVDALQEAVAEPAAFLRPSATISELARHAAKASITLFHLSCWKLDLYPLTLYADHGKDLSGLNLPRLEHPTICCHALCRAVVPPKTAYVAGLVCNCHGAQFSRQPERHSAAGAVHRGP